MKAKKIGDKIELKAIKDSPGLLSIFCLIFVTVAFLAAGLAMFLINQERMPYYKETTAIITDIDVDRYWDSEGNEKVEYDVYVDYTVDGVDYSSEYGAWNAGMYVGQEITIFYDSRDPGKPLQSPTNLLIISCAFMGISIIPLIFAGKQIGDIVAERFRVKKLKAEGIRKRLPIVFIENANELESTAYHGKRISNRKYTVEISSNGRTRSYKYKKEPNGLSKLSKRERSYIRDAYAGRKSLLIFGCENEGLVYESLCFHRNDEIFEGCTAEVYFDKNQYDSAVSNKTWVKNYYVDMDSVEVGKRIAVKNEDVVEGEEMIENPDLQTATYSKGYIHTTRTVGKKKMKKDE